MAENFNLYIFTQVWKIWNFNNTFMKEDVEEKIDSWILNIYIYLKL